MAAPIMSFNDYIDEIKAHPLLKDIEFKDSAIDFLHYYAMGFTVYEAAKQLRMVLSGTPRVKAYDF